MGRSNVSASPKPILRDALEENFIKSIDIWFDFLEARNTIAHVYNEKQAKKVFAKANTFSTYADELIANIKRLSDEYSK